MELPFGEFDLILGLDCLDCATESVVLRTEGDSEVVVIGERPKSWFLGGCEAYLAHISVSDSGDSLVKDIRTVKEFPDVFPEELPGLPLNREVEFGIELLPRTAPASIAPL
ncbi:hypothetical protein EPI10_021261 [Gossypium australe]|uniref:Reverse transcriptase domain-containing protein n=1 Tax=Gossypium australe TaxID=47621 RepID=A0A5B6WHG9_9ROSI|nr:hypothetical protein EPI10_021261 [Gossypium australe]